MDPDEDLAPENTALLANEEEVREIIRQETRDIVVWRTIVALLLAGMAVASGVLWYFYLWETDTVATPTNSFPDLAYRVETTVSIRLQQVYDSLRALSNTVISVTADQEWPLVSVTDFPIHAESVPFTAAVWMAAVVSDRGAWETWVTQTVPPPVREQIYTIQNRTFLFAPEPGPYAPVALVSPPATTDIPLLRSPINYDLKTDFPILPSQMALSDVRSWDILRWSYDGLTGAPRSVVLQPLLRSGIVGYIQAFVEWESLLRGVLLDEDIALMATISNTCQETTYSWSLDGPEAVLYLGGDYALPRNLPSMSFPLPTLLDSCDYTLALTAKDPVTVTAPSSKDPRIFAGVLGALLGLLTLAFMAYDRLVRRRNHKILSQAAKSNAIVSSLFPQQVRDRLYAGGGPSAKWAPAKSGLRSFLDEGEIDDAEDLMFETKPIADLFPETTVMFADIVGFTAWSSVREPSQVFMLLETLYRALDRLARKRNVFKVETVGDCYVAVCGLPEPRKDHAVAMCRFAQEGMKKIQEVTKKLEVSLGPDTAELTARVGIHSGPVTAGVLRGERSRFQLFGDTMNTAARMESTGTRDKIHISQETADLLVAAGKAHWLSTREGRVQAKGKGELQTYWLEVRHLESDKALSTMHESMSNGLRVELQNEAVQEAMADDKVKRVISEKMARLIDWNVDVLLRLLRAVVARREAEGIATSGVNLPQVARRDGATVLEEVLEILPLPPFDANIAKHLRDQDEIVLDTEVTTQLHGYVRNIAIMYNENPFHNFEHASHVTMSVTKLLSRIVAPTVDYIEEMMGEEAVAGNSRLASTLHDHTYGITSDALTQFSCVFSALIHDVDHTGVPNTQLVKENAEIAAMYKGKSVAEQNSIDLAWDLLMDSDYTALRRTIYATEYEQRRFRNIVVNSVMATDIMDRDLKTLRNARWDKAFREDAHVENLTDATNRKATIVIEHLIQASDVAHTMQHWHIFRKWNQRLFEEMYVAFLNGRAEKDPSASWYQGEIGFFDFYIIPLAKKLKDCGVFGVSSDEYLNYAVKNRQEWETRGRDVVAEMIETVQKKLNRTPTVLTPLMDPAERIYSARNA